MLLRPLREKQPIPLEFSNRTGRPCESCQLEHIGRSRTKDRKIARSSHWRSQTHACRFDDCEATWQRVNQFFVREK